MAFLLRFPRMPFNFIHNTDDITENESIKLIILLSEILQKEKLIKLRSLPF